MGFGPAVIRDEEGNKVLHHISSSQINVYEKCPYRWHEEKVNLSPDFRDWSWTDVGVAAHEILKQQVGAFIGKEFNESKRRVLNSSTRDEAEKMLSGFVWQKYFENHNIIDVEVEMVLDLSELNKEIRINNNESKDVEEGIPLFVLSLDVISTNKDGIIVITEWKTGYSCDKGIDIQTKGNILGVMKNMNCKKAVYRRIYPRLAGEKHGTKKVEEYYFNTQDAEDYAKTIILFARKMKATVENATRTPKAVASNSCVHCPVAYSCPIASKAAFSPAQLIEKSKVLKAAQNQVDNALKEVVEKGGDFYVGKEHYGFILSESYKVPRSGPKPKELLELLMNKNPQLLKDSSAKVHINKEIKKFLENEGYDGYKYAQYKNLKLLNEKELKYAAREYRKKQTTRCGFLKDDSKKAA